jgi:hypothetical protein
MEYFVPFKNVAWTSSGDRESRDMRALRGVTVEAASEDEAVEIVGRVLDRWNVDFQRVEAEAVA